MWFKLSNFNLNRGALGSNTWVLPVISFVSLSNTVKLVRANVRITPSSPTAQQQ
jgi:hypothetical protein